MSTDYIMVVLKPGPDYDCCNPKGIYTFPQLLVLSASSQTHRWRLTFNTFLDFKCL